MPQVTNTTRWKWLILLPIAMLLAGWLLSTPPGILGKADAIGYAVCHRIDIRSFHLGERQLPLCIRCSGMYLGAVTGLIFLTLRAPRRTGFPRPSILVTLGVLVIAFVFDSVNSYLDLFPIFPGFYEPQNTLRLITGTGMGLAMAMMLFPAFNQTVWEESDARPVLESWRAFLGLLVLTIVLDILVLTEQSVVLYVLAWLSTVGILVLLTLVYTVLWLFILRREKRYNRLAQLWLTLACGFGTALVQIALFDLARWMLTGTWDGFHIG